jgi:glutathione synthase/RimK-type ligase-like ATP-grasp enzyme
MKIIPYKIGSQSASLLAEGLGIWRVNPKKTTRVKTDTLINWGCSQIVRPIQCKTILNLPEYVTLASNKLSSFKEFKQAGVPTPEWIEDRVEAVKWLTEGYDVCVRHRLNGHSGEGLEVVLGEKNNPNFAHDLPEAPLYTKYIPKDQEYRAHVFDGRVIFTQRKARKLEVPDEEVNWKVRNLAGGFIYANQAVELSPIAADIAVDAVNALGLDFGAVDIIYNKRRDAYYVLEVNTAPGLSGSTLEAYVEAFNGFAEGN